MGGVPNVYPLVKFQYARRSALAVPVLDSVVVTPAHGEHLQV